MDKYYPVNLKNKKEIKQEDYNLQVPKARKNPPIANSTRRQQKKKLNNNNF